jgi:hypothetical protein
MVWVWNAKLKSILEAFDKTMMAAGHGPFRRLSAFRLMSAIGRKSAIGLKTEATPSFNFHAGHS